MSDEAVEEIGRIIEATIAEHQASPLSVLARSLETSVNRVLRERKVRTTRVRRRLGLVVVDDCEVEVVVSPRPDGSGVYVDFGMAEVS